MKEKLIEMCLLLDVYGKLLTEKQRDLVDFYYNEDLSLGEIAENLGISRQGVRDGLVHAEEALRGYEEKLGLMKRMAAIRADAEVIKQCAEEVNVLNKSNYFDTRIAQRMEKIIELSDATMSKLEL